LYLWFFINKSNKKLERRISLIYWKKNIISFFKYVITFLYLIIFTWICHIEMNIQINFVFYINFCIINSIMWKGGLQPISNNQTIYIHKYHILFYFFNYMCQKNIIWKLLCENFPILLLFRFIISTYLNHLKHNLNFRFALNFGI